MMSLPGYRQRVDARKRKKPKRTDSVFRVVLADIRRFRPGKVGVSFFFFNNSFFARGFRRKPCISRSPGRRVRRTKTPRQLRQLRRRRRTHAILARGFYAYTGAGDGN